MPGSFSPKQATTALREESGHLAGCLPPAMTLRPRQSLGTLLASLAIMAWVLTALLPAGTVLCVADAGGGEWCGTIAARGDHGPRCRSERAVPPSCEATGAGCRHHDLAHTDSSDHSAPPCTDIPAAEHMARDRSPDRAGTLPGAADDDTPCPSAALKAGASVDIHDAWALRCSFAAGALPDCGAPPGASALALVRDGHQAVRSLSLRLRAIILQI